MNTTALRFTLVVLLFGCGSTSKPPTGHPTRGGPHGVRVASLHEPGSLSGDSVPRFFPNYVKPCKATVFREVMKDDLNASLTRISEALFHGQGDDDARMEQVADSAGAILGCAVTINTHRPATIAAEQWPAFDHMLNQLVLNTHALQTAALEDDRDTVVHWYHHVKQSCAACHARFFSR